MLVCRVSTRIFILPMGYVRHVMAKAVHFRHIHSHANHAMGKEISMSKAAKVVDLIIAAGHSWPGGRENAQIERTYAGGNQRKCGAWSWFLMPINNDLGIFPDVGSQIGVTELFKNEIVVSWDKHTRSVVLDPLHKPKNNK